MNSRKKQGTASEHGDDTDLGAEFESFVMDQFKLLLDGQKALRSEVRALEEKLGKNVEMLESCLERNEEKSRQSETKLRDVERQTTKGSERVKSATEESTMEGISLAARCGRAVEEV
ncbi:uncharacterized protein LOC144916296 [Branchiostoma floridae x Branchiostoma belcheri]